MKIGTIWNKTVKGFCWFMIQLFALFECYVLAFMCTSVVSTLVITVCSFIPACSAWIGWVFSHFGMVSLLACIPITLVLFIYLQVSLHGKPKQVQMNVENIQVQK